MLTVSGFLFHISLIHFIVVTTLLVFLSNVADHIQEHHFVHTGNSFPFPHMFSSNISLKTWVASFSRAAWERQDRNHRDGSEEKKRNRPADMRTSVDFKIPP